MFTSEIMNDGYDVYMNKSDVTKDPEEVKGHYYNNKIHWVNKNVSYSEFQSGDGVIALDPFQFYDFINKWYYSSKADTDPSFSINVQRWYECYLRMMKNYYLKNFKESTSLWTYYDSVTLHSITEHSPFEYCSPKGKKCFINFPKGRVLEPEITWAFIDCLMKSLNGKNSLFEARVEDYLRVNHEKTVFCALDCYNTNDYIGLGELIEAIKLHTSNANFGRYFESNLDEMEFDELFNKAFNNPIDIAKGKIVNTLFITDFVRRLLEND